MRSLASRLPYTMPATKISTAVISPTTSPVSPTMTELSDMIFPSRTPSILVDSDAVKTPSILELWPMMVLIILVLMVSLFFFDPNIIILPACDISRGTAPHSPFISFVY